jgi:type I site-specific restriction endonuclease
VHAFARDVQARDQTKAFIANPAQSLAIAWAVSQQDCDIIYSQMATGSGKTNTGCMMIWYELVTKPPKYYSKVVYLVASPSLQTQAVKELAKF